MSVSEEYYKSSRARSAIVMVKAWNNDYNYIGFIRYILVLFIQEKSRCDESIKFQFSEGS